MLPFVPQILFFDIDDTLYDKQHGVHPTTQSALQALQQRGIRLAIATGRSPAVFPPAVQNLIEQLQIDTIVAINGQYCRHGDELLHDQALPLETLEAFVQLCQQQGLEYCMISEHNMVASQATERVNEALCPIGPFTINPYYYQKHSVYQMLLFADEQELAQFPQHPLLTHYKAVRWHRYSVDVLPQQVSKALGIGKLCTRLGIDPKHCMAFGDGWNDVEMFETVGFAVAMGNAVEAVKARAQFVTTTTAEGGIAHALTHLHLL